MATAFPAPRARPTLPAVAHPTTTAALRNLGIRRPGLVIVLGIYLFALCCADSASTAMMGLAALAVVVLRTVLVIAHNRRPPAIHER